MGVELRRKRRKAKSETRENIWVMSRRISTDLPGGGEGWVLGGFGAKGTTYMWNDEKAEYV